MSTIPISQPLPDTGIYSVNFFNGRLLSGEDLSTEQDGNREARSRLAKSIGAGVITGLEVTKSPPPLPGELDPGPSVIVRGGMAINSQGQTLVLPADMQVLLVSPPPAASATSGQGTFGALQASPVGQYTLGQGIYLLTIAYDTAKSDSTPTSVSSSSGSGSSTAGCTSSFSVDTIQFHLIQLTISSGLLGDADHQRNKLAYACFGFPDTSPNILLTPPDYFNPLARNVRLLEAMQANAVIDLTNDVPLAILNWSSDGTLNFIDAWSVRRRAIRPAFTSRWQDVICDQRLAEAEAMYLQFQAQIDDILQGAALASQSAPPTSSGQTTSTSLNTLSANQVFDYLPAAGYLPVGTDSFDWKTFLGSLAPPAITCVDRRFFRQILHNSFYQSPIKVGPYADKTPSNEPPVDVYQDASETDSVIFARSSTGRTLITINAQGYQPASVSLSFTVGQQTQLTVPLQQAQQGGPQAAQPPVTVDVDSIQRPALHRVRFSIIQQPAKAADVIGQKIAVQNLPQNVVDWLNQWQTWFNALNPNQGIDCATPTIYMNDYYTPPKRGDIPQEPAAYAVFGGYAVPLLVILYYYTTPLPVPLSRAGIRGLTNDAIQALAGIGIYNVDQVTGAWAQLIANAVGQPIDYGTYLITDALQAAERINERLGYYEGMNEEVKEILEQMSLNDDVALANADQQELGDNLKSEGFANRLIVQARQAIAPEHWSLESLGLKPDQVAALQKIGVDSKGAFARRAESNRTQLENTLGLNQQAIDDLHAKANAQITASSLALARVKDLILLPNVNAEVATKLAASNINTVDEVHKTDKQALMQITGLSEDAAEDLKEEAEAASKEGLEVEKLATVTKDVANILDTVLQVKTVSHLLEQGEEKVAEALKATHGDRAVHFVKALFDGIRGAGR